MWKPWIYRTSPNSSPDLYESEPPETANLIRLKKFLSGAVTKKKEKKKDAAFLSGFNAFA